MVLLFEVVAMRLELALLVMVDNLVVMNRWSGNLEQLFGLKWELATYERFPAGIRSPITCCQILQDVLRYLVPSETRATC